jgi:apolipoprotein N-acyltransferase
MVQGVHSLRQYGVRPEAWHWYRVHGRARPAPTAQYRAMKRRSALKSVLMLVLVVAAVVLAMPVIYWSAVVLHVSLNQMAPVTLGVLLVGVALFLAIFVAWGVLCARRGRRPSDRPLVAASLVAQVVCWLLRESSVRGGLRQERGVRAARPFYWNFCCESLGPPCKWA